MSHTEDVLNRAIGLLAGVMGSLTLMLVARRPVSRRVIRQFVGQLRMAADVLEELDRGKTD